MSAGITEMPFATERWLADEALGMCSPATRGIWIDALAAMWKADRCGELSGTIDQLAQLCRCHDRAVMRAALAELRDTGAADVTLMSRECHSEKGLFCHDCSSRCHAIVTLVNRRMKAAHVQRLRARERQQSKRRHANVRADVTPMSRECHALARARGVEDLDLEDLENTNARARTSHADVTPPDWMPEDAWREFLFFRRQSGKPLTPLAQKRAIGRLKRLADDGHDPAAVLKQSCDEGWSNLYPLRGSKHAQDGRTRQGSRGSRPSAVDRVRARRESSGSS